MGTGQWVVFYYQGVVMGGTVVEWDGSVARVSVNGNLYDVNRRDLY